jgi:hypothetical protein
MPQVISKLSLVIHFLIWATENPQKIDLCQLFCFDRFLPLFVFASRSLSFFSSFDHGTFGEVATVVYALYVLVLSWNLKQMGLIHYYAYTNVANRIVLSFVWRKFSSVRIGEWWDELKNGQTLKLGDAPEAPLLHRQKSGHISTHYIFIASCTMHFSWSVLSF